MSEVRTAWSEAGERLTGLGQKLKRYYDEERAEPVVPAADPAEEPVAGRRPESEPREQVKEAVRKLGIAVEDVFDAIGKSAKDPAVKEDVKQVGQSLAGALGVTFAEVSDELRKAFAARSAKGQGAKSEPTDSETAEPTPIVPEAGTPAAGQTTTGPAPIYPTTPTDEGDVPPVSVDKTPVTPPESDDPAQ